MAGFGTTFAAAPDLLAIFKRRSSQGMNPTMAGIMGTFQIVWVYYGILIDSMPVIVWNIIVVVINFLMVGVFSTLPVTRKISKPSKSFEHLSYR